jgi:protein arginine N-methyltransferase 1
LKEPIVDAINQDMINTSTSMILDLDLVKMKKDDVNFCNTFKITCSRNDTFSGLVAWFDTGFTDLENPIWLSTSPFKQYTHWKQTTFYSEDPCKVERDDIVTGSIACRQSTVNHRELDIKISYHVDNNYGESSSVS